LDPVFGDTEKVEGLFMKRLAFAAALSIGAASSALAADFPPYAAPPRGPAPYYVPPPVVPPYSWGGFYVGGNLGAGWSGVGTFSDSAGSTFSSTTSSTFVGGGQFGLNYEFYSGVVIGAEVMFDWAPNTKIPLPSLILCRLLLEARPPRRSIAAG
jgi:outer membrane immunogenic protein